MDDVLIYADSEELHDQCLEEMLKVTEAAGLNRAKCNFRQRRVQFLGPIIDEKEVRLDPGKVTGMMSFLQPQNVTELKRFLGMVNYLGKYIPNLTPVRQSLYELLKMQVEWIWQHT